MPRKSRQQLKTDRRDDREAIFFAKLDHRVSSSSRTGILRYGALLSWGDIATWAAMSSLSAFVWVFFGTGNKWLALAGSATYGSTLLFYLGPGSGPDYLKITGLKTMETYGGAAGN